MASDKNIDTTLTELPENKADAHIWGIYFALVAISIVELYSASSREIASSGLYYPLLRHVGQLFVGFLIILGLQRMHYRWFIPLIPLFVIMSVGMMVYVLFCGEIINGARRAFTLPFISVQPSEFIKLSAVLVCALVLSRTQLKKDPHVRNRGVWIVTGCILLFGGLLFTQGLTNTILLMAISVSMMCIGYIRWKNLLMVLLVYGLVGMAGMAAKFMLKERRDATGDDEIHTEQVIAADQKATDRSKTWRSRIDSFMNPTPPYMRKITSANRQEMFSYMAQANGGIHGVLPGNSRESARLPLAFSDYIFAIIVEDWGLIGGFFVMLLYLWLLVRAGSIAGRCSQAFPSFLVTGMAVLITFQALFHMAIVTGVFPVSGQPLPLFSKAGTSILITSIAFGIMLSVSRYAVRNGKKQAIRAEAEALPESIRADNPAQF
ncbi:MAG: FtsW/RodA/SpoVE family cell cycle protein [Muribaculaceae bacterium]|nr:FtsW/RodA/SpoVE family cell cycle protein [Muribaculaceae bacterium]